MQFRQNHGIFGAKIRAFVQVVHVFGGAVNGDLLQLFPRESIIAFWSKLFDSSQPNSSNHLIVILCESKIVLKFELFDNYCQPNCNAPWHFADT